MKKSKKIIIFAVIILVVAAGAVFFFHMKGMGKKDEERKAAEESRSYPVRISECVSGDISDFIKINGSVIAEKSVDVNPDTGGRIRIIHAEIGDFVKKGEVLAEVDPSKPGLSYTFSPVRSPISGTVTALHVEAGSTVTVSSVIATIGDLSELRVETEIPEPKISAIKMGSEAVLSFVAYPENKYPARVVEISPVVNPLSRTMKIKLEFMQSHDEVKAGMFGSVKLFTDTSTDTLKIPSAAVVVRDSLDTVFVLDREENLVRKVRIEKGITADGITEVVSGLSAGDLVVTAGQNLLEDRVNVIVLESGSPEENGEGS